MKRSLLLVLLACVVTSGLSACYVVPIRDRDGSYRDDREHRRDGGERDGGRHDDGRRDDGRRDDR